jgi:hypothetical protein
MADPNGIVWDDEAPSGGDGVVWDDEQAGPPAADFSNVRGGPAQRFGPVNAPRGTLAGLQDFSPEGMALDPGTAESVAQGAKDIAGELESGVKGAAENYQYPQELDANGQPKRRVGLFEAFGRRAASGFEDLADLADKFNPASAGTRIAASVTGQPTAFAGEAEATRVNPEKEQYEGAREELVGNLGADLLTNFAPFERLGSAASKLMKAPWLKTPAKEAALVGELGPGPQGAATADEIVDQALDHAAKSSAVDIAVTPEMRAPAEESRAVVPDAAMDASAAPGPGPAELPTGESVPEQAAPAERAPGGPDLGVAAPQPSETVAPEDSTSRCAAKLEDHPAAVAEYSANPDTEGGTVINTDTARELSPDYLADRTQSAAVHEPASAFTKRLYADKLAAPTPEGFEPEVLFTAGGTGAGKSTGRAALAESGALGKPEIVYDTNMNSYASARQKIDQALEAGRKVKILYTYRDPVEALRNGALPRAMRQEGEFGSGRTVPIEEHLKTHLGSYDTVQQIARDFHENPDVEVYAIDNSRGRGNARPVALSEVPNPHRETLREELHASLNEAHANGEISQSVREGFLRDSQRKPEGESPRGSVREESQPPRAERPQNDVGPSDAEAVRGDQGQTRSAGRAGSRGEDQRGENLQRAGQEKRAAFAQRVPETRAVEGADAPEAPGLASGISNARVNAERAERGLEEVAHNLGRSDPESIARVRQRFEENPNYGADLARSFVERPRAATKEEGIALALDRSRIKNARRDAYERAEKAQDAGDTAALETARKETDRLDAELEQNDIAAKHTGHEWAEAGRARQMLMREDYTMAEMVRRQKVKKGGALTEKERAAVEARAKDIEAREAALAKREAELTAKAKRPDSPFRQRDAAKRFDALVEEMKKTSRKTLCEVA